MLLIPYTSTSVATIIGTQTVTTSAGEVTTSTETNTTVAGDYSTTPEARSTRVSTIGSRSTAAATQSHKGTRMAIDHKKC